MSEYRYPAYPETEYSRLCQSFGRTFGAACGGCDHYRVHLGCEEFRMDVTPDRVACYRYSGEFDAAPGEYEKWEAEWFAAYDAFHRKEEEAP